MGDEGLIEKTNRTFADLISLTNEELKSRGLTIEPQIIVEKIVTPLKELYIKNLTALLESFLQRK